MSPVKVPLPPEPLDRLRRLARQQGTTVEALARQAVEDWLDAQDATPAERWRTQLGALLQRRQRVAAEEGFDQAEVDRDVAEAVDEVRGRAPGSR